MPLRQFCKNILLRFRLYLGRGDGKKLVLQFFLGILIFFIFNIITLTESPLFKGSLSKFKDLAAVAQSSPSSQQLMQQGREFFQTEQFSQAATVWQQAATIFKTSEDRLNEALALNYLSLAYQQLEQWQEATEAISSSLAILPTNKNRNTGTEQLSILAQALNTQGHLQLALGKPEEALAAWQEAASAYSQISDIEGAIGSQINQAQAMQAMGLYRRARKTLEEVELSLQNQPNSLIKATGLRSLGNALRVSGDLEKSRKLLQQSLKVSQQLDSNSAISAVQLSLGNTARAIAQRAIVLKNTKTEKAEIQAALDAYKAAAEISSSSKIRLQAQLNQFSLLTGSKQFREAEVLLPAIQLQIEQLPASRRSVYARINLAHSLLPFVNNSEKLTNNNQPQITDVANVLAIALQQSKTLKDQRAESYALGSLGELYELSKQSQEAQNLTQQALVLAQAMNASDIAYRWQWQLGRLLKERGEKKEAIKAYSVAVETLQSLRSDLVAINRDNPDVQFSFRESVEPVYRELVDLLITTENESSQENLRQARQVIESLQLAELDNFFQEACLDAKPVQIDQVDAGAAIIYPIILKDRLAVILALPQSSLRLYSTLKPQQEIESIVNQLQQDIGRLAANNQKVLQSSQQVYDWLIRPAEAELKQSNAQTLVFVLDGLLRNVPMGALHDGEQYLIEKYSIAVTPGLQLLPPQPLAREELEVLTAGISEERQGFSELPNVERELQQINAKVPSRILLNEAFTNSNLQKEIKLSPFPVVHIATHGQFSSQAENTFVLSWDGVINVKDLDSLLRGKEQDLSRPIELLVFSACETAEGDNRAALGLAGIAVRAGARSTLATLWKVSDNSTATLMVRFYEELAKESSVTKAEALRRAQLSLLQERRYKIPYFWAPYVLVGNWR
ncbi:MAG: CHAT domain-containing protein [Microcoleus vaginatus WJT46-NPBG5]|jgi:CHAT domain-containing protein|nr:CHAT domain-containing protein [Microcoleus vaginatus WJT46-NPBG5]